MYSPEIDAFLQITRNRSFSRAAEEMHLAQSTVSKRLQILEEFLGYSLIERGKGIKHVQLTPQGTEFYDIAERWQDLVHEAQEIGRTQRHYNLKIGTVPSANMTFVPQLCRKLLNHTPCVDFRVVSLHSVEMYDEIEKRNIDVGFSLVEQVHASVSVKPSFSVPFIGIRLKRAKGAAVVDVRSLDPVHCIYFAWGTRYQTWHEYWFHAKGKPRATIDNPYILFELFEHQEQWAVVPMAIANLLLQSGRFESFRIEPQPPDRIFFKLTHKDVKAHIKPAIEIFSHYLKDALRGSYSNVYCEL